MQLFVTYVVLALGVSGHNSDCDINSHLAIRKVSKVTKESGGSQSTSGSSTYLISEFDPKFASTTDIEISGPPGEGLDGCIWMMDGGAAVFETSVISDFLDANGLLLATLFVAQPLPEPFILFLSETCPTPGSDDIGSIQIESGRIYDSIGVPTTEAEENTLRVIRSQMEVCGTDLKLTDQDEPELVFRDKSVGDLYVVPAINYVPIFDANGNEVDPGDFSSDPLVTTFGDINPTYEGNPNPTFLISEFDPTFASTADIEISGPPVEAFDGCIWTMDSDEVVSETSLVSDFFDGNGLLVVTTFFSQPSPTPFILFLSELCPTPGSGDIASIVTDSGRIYDSIGVPTSQNDEIVLGEIRSALGVCGTDLNFTGAEPQLAFRDASVGDLYAVEVIGSGPVFEAQGEVDPSEFDNDPQFATFGAINPTKEGGVIGDPHIRTLAGDHYTLLREGSFLLWEFALKKPHVKWQIYAHYAGHQSFTKGLLLVDTSGPQPSSMEITSEKCEWKTNGKSTEWAPITSENEVVLSGSSSGMKVVGHQRKDMKKIDLFLADKKKAVASLKVMCRQGHHINLKLHMTNQKWGRFVTGELKGQKHQNANLKIQKLSTLQLDATEDQEFQVQKTWKELGGSSHAEQYLQHLDEHPRQTSSLIQICDPEAEVEARALCLKHLGKNVASNSVYFKDCIFDVCSGAGEVAAEMAAEMLRF